MNKALRILILEDRASDADLVEDAVRQAGIIHTAKRVMTEKEFVRALREFSPDIILCDYDLPQYNGSLALAAAKARCPDIPFILVTGVVGKDRTVELLTSGKDDSVMMGFLHRLVPAVKRALGNADGFEARRVAQNALPEACRAPGTQVAEAHAEMAMHRQGNDFEQVLNSINNIINSTLDFEEIMNRVVVEACKAADVDTVTISERQGNGWIVSHACHHHKNIVGTRLTDGQATTSVRVEMDRHYVIYSGKDTAGGVADRYKTGSGLAVPLIVRDRVIGVLHFNYLSRPRPFTQAQIDFANSLAVSLSLSLSNAKLYEELQRELDERKRAENALLASKERIETILNSITDIYIAFDREWHFTEMNTKAENALGKRREEVLGKTIFEVFPRMNDEAYRRQYQNVMASKTPLHLEAFPIAGKWLETHGYPAEEGISVYFRDITDRKQAEDELKKNAALLQSVNKELESFSYSVSHNLQAPLRAIKGFSQMILRNKEREFDDETKRRLNVIQENTENMQLLIKDLLALSRVSRQAIVFRTIDMDDLLDSVWKECTMGCPEKPLVLKADALPPAYGDHILIRQVLSNILTNAIKYSQHRDPVEINVGSYRETDGNVYSVKDNGVGFDMKYYDKLFGVFERLHSAAEFEGTGVGLSIAQRIIHRHGGRIWAESKVDEGAVFYFMLPGEKTEEPPQASKEQGL